MSFRASGNLQRAQQPHSHTHQPLVAAQTCRGVHHQHTLPSSTSCSDPPQIISSAVGNLGLATCLPQQLVGAFRRQRHICRATAGPEKSSVVELLWLLKARSDVDPEQIEELLDSLWSLQYLVPAGILCASAGPVVSCTAYEQQQPQQPVTTSSSLAAAGQAEQRSKGRWQCGFTHAVHFRLGSRLNLEHLMAHPLMSSSRDAVDALCTDHAQLVFEGMVAKRLEALFRRGEEFESGVEHVLLLQPSSDGGLGADAFLAQLAELAESSVAGGIQASHGAVISCVHAAATHVLMTRFAAPQQVQQLLGTPACAAVVAADPRVPVVAVSSLSINIQPTEESTQVSRGVGGPGL